MTAIELRRLRARGEFLFVRDGCKAANVSVLVEARRRTPSGPIGLGFTASRKVGGAVQRNRARRRLKEAARRLLPAQGLPGVDYVLVARQSTPDAPWGALLDDLQNALIRVRASLEGAESQRPIRRPRQGAKRPDRSPGSN